MTAAQAALVEAIADALAPRVAALLADQLGDRQTDAALVTAAELAEQLNVRREWVYRHSAELGAVRLGDSDSGRVRFNVQRVRQLLGDTPGEHKPTAGFAVGRKVKR